MGTRQEDSISAYLFILVLEVIFVLIDANPNIEGLEFLTHNFLYSAYADNTTSFIRNENLAFKSRILESLAGCCTIFFAVFCKIGALEHNAY